MQHSYIYVTDVTGDTVPDDLCALYGYPYPLAFPYYAPYGYLPNNLIIALAMDCTVPENASATSWGRVKALYE